MGAGGSTAKKKKANSPGKADEQRPKKSEKGGESVVSGGDEAEKVAAERTAADKGDKVEELDVFVLAKCYCCFICVGLFLEAMGMHGNTTAVLYIHSVEMFRDACCYCTSLYACTAIITFRS